MGVTEKVQEFFFKFPFFFCGLGVVELLAGIQDFVPGLIWFFGFSVAFKQVRDGVAAAE